MSFVKTFEAARAELGVAADADPRAVKRAYRRAVQTCPPDRDPEGFQRVRDAYELLTEPVSRGLRMLGERASSLPKPDLPAEPAPDPQELHVLFLRRAALRLRAEDLLGE